MKCHSEWNEYLHIAVLWRFPITERVRLKVAKERIVIYYFLSFNSATFFPCFISGSLCLISVEWNDDVHLRLHTGTHIRLAELTRWDWMLVKAATTDIRELRRRRSNTLFYAWLYTNIKYGILLLFPFCFHGYGKANYRARERFVDKQKHRKFNIGKT